MNAPDFKPSRRGHCVHFNGTQNECCDAGISYAEAFGPLERRSCRAPCLQEYKSHERIAGKLVPVWKPWHRQPGEEMHCEKFRLPTAEEIAAEAAEMEAAMNRMRLVMQVVRSWRTWTPQHRVAKQEVIECPACKGRLLLSQAAYNGHVWGKCETEGCVSWME